MNPYANFTDAQLAEWHQHVTQLENQKAELEKLRAQLDAERVQRDRLQHHLAKTTEEYQAERMTIIKDRNEAFDAATRSDNQLRVLSRNLMPIVADWLECYAAFEDKALTPALRQRRREAVELMRLMTPFAS
jgi:hypothetical protein